MEEEDRVRKERERERRGIREGGVEERGRGSERGSVY